MVSTAIGRYIFNAEREAGVINDIQSPDVKVLVLLFLYAQWDERLWALGRRLVDADLVLPFSIRVPGPNRNRGIPQRRAEPRHSRALRLSVAPSLLRCRTTPTPTPPPPRPWKDLGRAECLRRGVGDRNHRNKARLGGAPVGIPVLYSGAGLHAVLADPRHTACSGQPLSAPSLLCQRGQEESQALSSLHGVRGVENTDPRWLGQLKSACL